MLKNTLFFSAAFGFLMVGCGGDKDGTTGDTGTTTGDDDDDTTFTPIVDEIDEETLPGVTCSGTVTFEAGFYGDAAYGLIDAIDSANTPPWNEAHTLDATSNAQGEQPYTDLASPAIPTGVALAQVGDGTGSLFTCDDHYNDVVMTYALRVYTAAGLADCVAWGDDPSGFTAGDYDAGLYNDLIAPSELRGCGTIAAAR